jgi:hypothetical protein
MRYLCRNSIYVSIFTYLNGNLFVKIYVKNINKYFVHLARQFYHWYLT